MGINLEHQLGELNGQLKALVPALEKQETRLHEAEGRAAAAEARLDALRKEFDEYKNNTKARIGELFTKAATANTGIIEAKNEAKTAQDGVDRLKAREDGIFKKLWKLAEIVLAAGLASFLTWWLSKK